MSAECRNLVKQQLNIPLGSALDLGQVGTALAAGRVDLPTLRAMVSGGEIGGVLATLAPVSFGRARDMLTGPTSAANLPALTMAARTELSSAVNAASSAIAGATRDITAKAFTEAGKELQYSVSVCRGLTTTGIELRRANELVLLRIRDGGAIESDHAGLADGTCGDRQRELEEAAKRHGIELTGRKQLNHGAFNGGELITAAAARRDPSLARATVTDADQPGGRTRDHRLFSSDSEAETSQSARLRRGGTT
jgi:hypothetical protein